MRDRHLAQGPVHLFVTLLEAGLEQRLEHLNVSLPFGVGVISLSLTGSHKGSMRWLSCVDACH